MKLALLLLSASIASLSSASQSGINCPGCTPMDVFTFDKLVNRFRFSLVKLDAAYPYGKKHEDFARVAKEAAKIGDLLVGEVGIKDYGEKDNELLAER